VTKVDWKKKRYPCPAATAVDVAAAAAAAVAADGVSGGCLPMNCGQA